MCVAVAVVIAIGGAVEREVTPCTYLTLKDVDVRA